MRLGCYAWIRQDGKVLLARLSASEPSQGQYTLPGGGLEFDEQPDACLIRELFEETGFHVKPRRIVHSLSWLADPTSQNVGLIYEVDIVGGELRFETDGSTDRLDWVPLIELDSVPTVPLVRNTAARYREGW